MTAATYSPQYLAESRATVLNVFYSIPIPLEIFSTAWRLWIKARIPNKGSRLSATHGAGLAFDDFLIVWATIVSVAVCISGLVYGPPYGMGRHVQAISAHDLQTFLMGDYIFSHLYDVAIASTKLSVLALYYRVFVGRTFRSIVIATVVFVLAWLVVMEVVLGFECRPIQAWWGATKGKCLNLVAFAYFTNITNLVCDLWIFCLPLPVILRLNMDRNKKIGLCFVFSIGLATCGISAARLKWVFSEGTTDITWTEVPLGIMSAWEPCGGILCANLPLVYRPLVNAFKTVKGTVTGTGHGTSRSHSTTAISKQQTNDQPDHEWTRIDSAGAIRPNNHQVTTEVYAGDNASQTTEMENIETSKSILVTTGIQQYEYQDADEIPLRGWDRSKGIV